MKSRHFTYLLAFVVGLAIPFSTAAADSVRIRKVVLDLPAGYTVHTETGFDSTFGEITIEGKPYTLRFDSIGWRSGPKNPSEFDKEILDGMIYYEVIPGTDPPACIYAWLHPGFPQLVFITLRTLGAGASFDTNVPKDTSLQEVYSVLRTIKITRFEASPHP